MHYKCHHSFRSVNDNSYYAGKVISHTEYNSLPINEQNWFTKVYDEENVSSDDFITPSVISSVIDIISDTSSFDSSSDSGSSFDGFGGGESGGGGAGSDF